MFIDSKSRSDQARGTRGTGKQLTLPLRQKAGKDIPQPAFEAQKRNGCLVLKKPHSLVWLVCTYLLSHYGAAYFEPELSLYVSRGIGIGMTKRPYVCTLFHHIPHRRRARNRYWWEIGIKYISVLIGFTPCFIFLGVPY